ncbi:hypothetical protein GCM10023189_00760 [Nibrella saemangeumensis]|uniref:Tail specific protease domain-containing protein n=2 Tax=Nibrella saemangeumensis TaxID=1084526 RepID=A0ABP8M8M5_9BACT
MQKHSLYAKPLDWKTIRDSVHYKARTAKSYSDVFLALVYAYDQLKDHHGMFANTERMHRFPPPRNPSDRMSEGIKKEYLKGPRIKKAMLANQVAYLKIPAMQVTKQDAVDQWANSLRDSLCALLSQTPSALIVDLRMNNGGNSVPMQAGVGSLFGDGIVTYTVDRDKKTFVPTMLTNGVPVDGTKPLATVKNTCGTYPTIPIAVLIGPSTVSSGEILAVAFKERKNTRLFGEPTAGFCNATEGFLFAKNQGYFLLSTSYIADKHKRIYTEQEVKPDVFVRSADNYEDLPSDVTVQAALNWLKQQVD